MPEIHNAAASEAARNRNRWQKQNSRLKEPFHRFISSKRIILRASHQNRDSTTWTDHRSPMVSVYGASLFLLLPLLQAAISGAQPTGGGAGTSHHDGRRFTPSMAIIVVVLISAFFLMAFFSVYLRLCAGDIRSGRSLRRSGTRPSRARRAARRGVDRAIIETFPVFEYSAVKGLKLGSEALECAVCLNEFEDDDNLRLLPACDHVFHPDCIDAWLASHATCPVCRSNVVGPDPTANAPLSETADPAAAPEDETRDEVPLHQVAIDVCDEENHQDLTNGAINPNQAPVPIRSKSTKRQFRFPRSHTTGHSLVQPGENVDRFTLRVPEHVRKEIVDGKLNRSASYAAFRTGDRSVSGGSSHSRVQKVEEESGRGRFKWRFERAAKSDRWASLAPPSFFWRSFSVRSQAKADDEQTANQKSVLPSVKTPLDCIGARAEAAAEQNPARSSNPVFTVSTE